MCPFVSVHSCTCVTETRQGLAAGARDTNKQTPIFFLAVTLPDSLARSRSPALPTMPVFYSPVPENLQMGLAYMGGSVFTNNRTADSDFSREQEDASGGFTSVCII